jgi:glutamate dehydrogenase (NAD(P)+)
MNNVVIFILDKNPLHRNLIHYNLVSQGFSRIYLFPSTEECIYRLERDVIPDFLILDYLTISETNPDFISHIKSFSQDIEVILFTESDDQELAQHLLELGASDYILKTKSLNDGISELIHNLKYLCKKGRYSFRR